METNNNCNIETTQNVTNKGKNIKKNYVLNLIYQITAILLPLIVTPYIARVLLPEGVGVYSFCFAIITYFTLIASFGFENYAQREISYKQGDKQQQSVLFYEIFLCRLISVLFALALNIILILSGAYGEYSIIMWILSLNIVAIGIDVVFYFQGNEEFGKIVLRNLIIKIAGTICLFIFIKTSNDVWLYTLINSLMLVISSLSLLPVLIKRLCKVPIKQIKPLKHFKPALKLFIPAIAITLYTVLDKFLIGVICCDPAQNGFYEQADKLIKIGMTVITCLSIVMIPRNSAAYSAGNIDEVKNNIYKATSFVWLIGLPITLGFIAIASNLVPWFLGEGYDNVITLMSVLAPLVLIIGFSNVFGLQYLIPCKKDKVYTICICLGALTNLILSVALIFLWGAVGACISTVIAEIAVTVSMMIVLRKQLDFKLIFKQFFKPIIASIIMFAIIYLISIYLTSSILNTFILIIVGAIVYFVLCLILQEKLVLGTAKNILAKIKRKKQ